MQNILNILPAHGSVDESAQKFISATSFIHSETDPQALDRMLKEALPSPPFPPIERLGCANVRAHRQDSCDQLGSSVCGGCRLVSYCSKTCQTAHWKTHKRDCKNPMRSEEWLPLWAEQGRSPSFMSDGPVPLGEGDPGMGATLWGNTPAIDVINLSKNENDPTKDFNIAFPASGDLRHVVRTINELPPKFSGKLKLIINDWCTPVAVRNFIILLILGTVDDPALAADIALHFWYSAFIPAEYHLRISVALTSFLASAHDDASAPVVLGPHSKLYRLITPESKKYLLHFVMPGYSVAEARREYDRVRAAPSRRDFRDRIYDKVRPSHRVARQAYWRFGIVLPFGAPNAHFNTPNMSLFSLTGKWFQGDFADPLEGWDMAEVIAIGKQQGTTPEDIYGCFYFYVKQQLQTFKQRMKDLSVTFILTQTSANDLALMIKGVPVPGINESDSESEEVPTSFDRIMVSNIVDESYVGIKTVIRLWAPLLAPGQSSVLVGYFMNWTLIQEDGRVRGAGQKVIHEVMAQYSQSPLSGKSIFKQNRSGAAFAMNNIGKYSSEFVKVVYDMEIFYDNSLAFSTYLEKQGLLPALKAAQLIRRKKHTIVPPRMGVPLESKADTLPTLPDEETWYIYNRLGSYGWVERYIELSRSG